MPAISFLGDFSIDGDRRSLVSVSGWLTAIEDGKPEVLHLLAVFRLW
jgi:hypothetical protein